MECGGFTPLWYFGIPKLPKRRQAVALHESKPELDSHQWNTDVENGIGRWHPLCGEVFPEVRAMAYDSELGTEPTRAEIDRTEGPVLLEFGASWCGHCLALAPRLAVLLREFPQVRHIKVEDGPGRPLGRSFRVKLWPSLVFLRDGQVLKQIARPRLEEVREGLVAIAAEGRAG
jgi:thioredoxin 1